MTTVAAPNPPPAAAGARLRRRLRRLGLRLKAAALLRGAAGWLTVAGGAALGLSLLDNLLALPAELRLPLAAGLLLGALAGLWYGVGRVLLRRASPERTARDLETRQGRGDNLFINACRLAAQPLSPAERALAEPLLGTAKADLDALPAAGLWQPRRLLPWASGGLAVLLLWSLYLAAWPHHARNAWQRLRNPLADVPPVAGVEIRLTPGPEVHLIEGESLVLQADLRPLPGRRLPRERPLLLRVPGHERLPLRPPAGLEERLTPVPGAPGRFRYHLADAAEDLSCRVYAGGGCSATVRITVHPRPRLVESGVRLTPPPYTGAPTQELRGPPATLRGLPGSRAELRLRFDQPVARPRLQSAGVPESLPLRRTAGDAWTGRLRLRGGGAYRLTGRPRTVGRDILLAAGEVQVAVDQPPAVAFVEQTPNLYLNPGAHLPLRVRAEDDYGLASLALTARRHRADGDEAAAPASETLKEWRYLGPPGPTGPVEERWTLVLDPAVFEPGATYLLAARALDRKPGREAVRSRPILLRVKDWEELSLPEGDPLRPAFARLRQAVEAQVRARAVTDNLQAHLEEVLRADRLADQAAALGRRQGRVRDHAAAALEGFAAEEAGAPYAAALRPLVRGEMVWLDREVAELSASAAADLPAALARVETRQGRILAGLLALLGEIAEKRRPPPGGEPPAAAPARPHLTPEEAAEDLHRDLERFARDQQRILEHSRTLLERGPQDLTEKEEAILGELAREEAAWARYFEEKLTDFSKLPEQDFADGAVAEEWNEVFQEIQKASEELYKQNVELAVPHEQAGLEGAEELMHNLERWLPDTPDTQKWLMEEPEGLPPIPMAELPGELEDIVGELLDDEEAMSEEVEDVTSSWMDSLDKGAGWDATDGPISNMSAKGVTGNRLPNEQEIGGRAGEGRTGRSHGQMVEETAQGKGGRETPTRLTPSPFEPGSVEDASREDPGGATGGGKQAGSGEEGLRGPVPPALRQAMERLGQRQAAIRQQAETVALHLRRRGLPSGDLETAIAAMQRLEAAAGAAAGGRLRQSYSRAVDALGEARRSVGVAAATRREENRLAPRAREAILAGWREGVPPGYEEMVSAYYQALAEDAPPAAPQTE